MSKWAKWTPLCGVAFVACLVVSFALPGNGPGVKASGAKVISYYVAHRGNEQAAGYMGMYAAVFFLFFAAAFRAYLRRTRPESAPLAALSFGAALVLTGGGALLSTTQIALSDAPASLSADAAQALNVINNDVFLPLIVGACAFMIANGLAVVRSGALPAWLGWVALAIGVVCVTPIGFFGFMATMGWVLVVSVLLVVREVRATAPTPQPAVTAT